MSWYFFEARAEQTRRFNYAGEPTFTCPNADPDPDTVAQIAALTGGSAQWVRRALGHHDNARAKVDGKLTDRCAFCGVKMKRLGFRVWEDIPGEDDEGLLAGRREITALFGGQPSDVARKVVWEGFKSTKRLAAEWAATRADE